MIETLWITLPSNPSNEENKLKEVIHLISSKNLASLSINQLIEKLENNQAADWLEVLVQYNSIPSINNINTSEMLDRAKGVRNKFGQRAYPQLKDRNFEPRELLGLVILCYSNPNLIGPKLCKALSENDAAAIKHEILENSARVGDRVAPWASNLRLANYALYANDTSVRLPVEVINRVKNETIQKGLTVHLVDQRGGFDEWVNGTERAARGVRSTSFESKLDSYQILQSLQSDQSNIDEDDHAQLDFPPSALQVNYAGNVLMPEGLSLNSTNSAVNTNYGNGLIISSLALFQVVRNTPIGAVARNIGKDLATVGKHVGSFFSKNHSEPAEQLEHQVPLLSSVAKP